MIVAEAPNSDRSFVVAPPAGWDPSPAEAAELLKLTNAPWLTPDRAGHARQPGARRDRPPAGCRPASGQPGELSAGYMSTLSASARDLSLYSRPARPAHALPGLAGRRRRGHPVLRLARRRSGPAARPGRQASSFMSDEESKCAHPGQEVRWPARPGPVPGVGAERPARHAHPGPADVAWSATPSQTSQLTVGASRRWSWSSRSMTETVRLHLHSAAIGTTTCSYSLATGSAAADRSASEPLSVESTRFGRVICDHLRRASACSCSPRVFAASGGA